MLLNNNAIGVLPLLHQGLCAPPAQAGGPRTPRWNQIQLGKEDLAVTQGHRWGMLGGALGLTLCSWRGKQRGHLHVNPWCCACSPSPTNPRDSHPGEGGKLGWTWPLLPSGTGRRGQDVKVLLVALLSSLQLPARLCPVGPSGDSRAQRGQQGASLEQSFCRVLLDTAMVKSANIPVQASVPVPAPVEVSPVSVPAPVPSMIPFPGQRGGRGPVLVLTPAPSPGEDWGAITCLQCQSQS